MDSATIKMPPAETVHPILKGSPNKNKDAKTTGDVAATNTSGNKKSAAEKHLTWDEHAIEEHDLLRGTRMKIDEPDTPYTHYDHHSDEESTSSGRHPRSPDENQPHHVENSLANQWNDISSKLQAVADKRDACPSSPTYSRDEDEEKKKSDEHEKFKDMRKKHYNEAEMMRKWREEHANDDDEEEEDEEEEDGAKMKL